MKRDTLFPSLEAARDSIAKIREAEREYWEKNVKPVVAKMKPRVER